MLHATFALGKGIRCGSEQRYECEYGHQNCGRTTTQQCHDDPINIAWRFQVPSATGLGGLNRELTAGVRELAG
jgi:hypothetical protein